MAQTTKRKPNKRKKKRTYHLSPAAVLLLILGALALSLFLLFRLFFAVKPPSQSSALEESAPTATQALPPTTLAAECFGEENGYKTYQSDALRAALGIDVSSHQGWIDWQAVAASDVDYAMLRAGYRGYTDGETNQDEYFQYNLESAADAGLDIGVYYFSQALTEEEAVEEANHVLDLVSGYSLAYPIYFDWETVEDENARTATISGSELTRCARAFCSTIENAGYDAGVYFNLSTAVQLYQLYDLKEYDFWLAEYQDIPSYPFAIDMWQYTNSGTVPGISVPVDLNLSFR